MRIMPRLVLVHGSVTNGATTWRGQRALGERWPLVVLERPGFPPGPPVERSDFEEDARWVAERLEPGDHLVGHSYGALIALLAAARGPKLTSLTVLEPPAFSLARGHAAVEEFVRASTLHWLRVDELSPEEFLRGFLPLVGSGFDPPSPLPPALEQGARTLMVERPPWEAEIPLDELRERRLPLLVVTGAHHDGFDAVARRLEFELGAEWAVLPGAGHAVQAAPGFAERLVGFLERAGA